MRFMTKFTVRDHRRRLLRRHRDRRRRDRGRAFAA
jgi:hypothetical protein